MGGDSMSENKSLWDKGSIALIAVAIIGSIVALSGIVLSIDKNESEIKQLEDQVTSLNETVTKLNTTTTNIVNYLNNRNEPFIQDVINFANATDVRLDELESRR